MAGGKQLTPESVTALAMLAGVRAKMDEYAREIFDLWFSGTAPRDVTFDNPKWATYMRADSRLVGQIDSQLKGYAESIRDEVEQQGGRLARPFSLTFHGEVGGPVGGYFTGYNVLHGTDRTVGDFNVSGQLTAMRSGPQGSAYVVTYTGLVFVFNDIVNANKRYAMDLTGLQAATNMAKALNMGPPRDYVLHIRWTGPLPVIVPVQAFAKGQAPGWLKTFPNR